MAIAENTRVGRYFSKLYHLGPWLSIKDEVKGTHLC